nr:FUSC family protein [Nocardioides panaciterrulae]
MTTRQAVQVTLAGVIAIGLGTMLSPTRYYWAVIAAFVTFTGTGTRAETMIKGSARIGGTLLGLFAAVLLAHLTVGNQVAIFATILGSIFMAFYLVKISYAAMTFFITILLGQLYTVLGSFSDQLLELRLGETAVGAVVGVLVAMVLAPLSTRDTVRSARQELLESLRELLEGVAKFADGERVDLDGLVRALDDRARRIALVARPLTRPLVLGHSPRRTRRRLGLYVTAVTQCRALVEAAQRRPLEDPAVTVAAARALADAVSALLATGMGAGAPAAEHPLRRSDVALFRDHRSARDEDPVIRHLHHLGATLTEIAETGIALPARDRSAGDGSQETGRPAEAGPAR